MAELTSEINKSLRSTSARQEVYYLKPDSHEAWILDFEVKKFRIFSLSQKIPVQFKSMQTNNGNIYVVGGVNSINQVLNDCFCIDK